MSPEMEADIIHSALLREQHSKRSRTGIAELLWIPAVLVLSWLAAFCF